MVPKTKQYLSITTSVIASMLSPMFFYGKIWRCEGKRLSLQTYMGYSIGDKLEWVIIFVYEFAKKHNLSMKQAYNYLHRFHGIEFIDQNYGYVHTQSFTSMVNDITEYCNRKGGKLQ